MKRIHLKHFLKEKYSNFSNNSTAWIDLKADQLEKDSELKRELFKLIDRSYNYIGGHVNIKNPSDIPSDYTIWIAKDVDGDGEPDVTKFAKKTKYGVKWAGSATDGSPEAKKELIRKSVEELLSEGNFAEVSGAIAHILLTKFGVTPVNDKSKVETIIGKKIEWVGKHPEGKYENIDGWYYRMFNDGEKHLKILIGSPILK